MRKVQDWENEKNANPAGRVKSKNADTEAIGRNTDAFQTKECLGYFWPQYLLKKLGKKQPRKQDMQVIWHKGQPIRGLVLDEEEGKPRGVIELSSISEKALDQVSSLGKGSEMVHPKGEEAAMQHLVGQARKRLAVKTRDRPDGGVSLTQSFPKGKKHGGIDSSDSEAMIEGVWGDIAKTQGRNKKESKPGKKARKAEPEEEESSGEEEASDSASDASKGTKTTTTTTSGRKRPRKQKAVPAAKKSKENPDTPEAPKPNPNETPQKRRGRPKKISDPAADQANEVGDVKQGPSGSPSGNPAAAAKESKRRTKEIELSEREVLSASQMLRLLADPKLVMTIKSKTMQDQLTKIQGRLTEALIALYSATFQSTGEEDRGMVVLDQLQTSKTKLVAANRLVEAMNSQMNNESLTPAMHLQKLFEEASAVTKVADTVKSFIGCAVFMDAYEGREPLADTRTLMNPSNPEGNLGAAALEKDDVPEFQSTVLRKVKRVKC